MHSTIQWLVYASRYAGIGGVEVYEMEDRPIEGFALYANVHRRSYLNALKLSALKPNMTTLPDTSSNQSMLSLLLPCFMLAKVRSRKAWRFLPVKYAGSIRDTRHLHIGKRVSPFPGLITLV